MNMQMKTRVKQINFQNKTSYKGNPFQKGAISIVSFNPHIPKYKKTGFSPKIKYKK